MKIARPPGGFAISLSPRARATLDAMADEFPRLADVWESICDRMRLTAHREGQPLPDGRLVIQFPGMPAYGVPTIAVTYIVVGDEVRVKTILIAG